MKIDNSVVEVLKTSEIDDCILRLPGQLDRKLYERVSKVLKMIGGKWSSSKKAFVFKEDVGDVITSIADTGEYVSDRQEFQFFLTPKALAHEIVKIADIRDGERTLEPSAGMGDIARFMPSPDCIELDPRNRAVLEKAGFHIVGDDFMEFEPSEPYDVIVMNPPFCKRQDARHILKAISIARRKVVAIASAAVLWRNDGPYEELRNVVGQYGGYMRELPDKSFKESGTMVKTALVVVEKDYDKQEERNEN
jgi:predicted RNA methylase